MWSAQARSADLADTARRAPPRVFAATPRAGTAWQRLAIGGRQSLADAPARAPGSVSGSAGLPGSAGAAAAPACAAGECASSSLACPACTEAAGTVVQRQAISTAAVSRSAEPASPGGSPFGEGPFGGEPGSGGLQGGFTPAAPAPAALPRPESCPPPEAMDCLPTLHEPAAVSNTVGFGTGSAQLGRREIAEVDAAVSAWRSAGGGLLRIDGYASAEGDCSENWLLSCRRAHAVADGLAHPSDHGRGVPTANLSLFAHGESDAAGRGLAANRRATIAAVPEPKPTPAPTPGPAPATPAPCAMPVLLGTGRTGCGPGPSSGPTNTDFTHNDHPAISPTSEALLASWAAVHTGGIPVRALVSDLACLAEMGGVLGLVGSAGADAVAHFVGGSGSTVTHGPGSTLGSAALVSSQFLATVAAVRADIEAQLAAQAASGVLDACALAVVPPETSWRFAGTHPALLAVIGGTHGESLSADSFSGSASARTYSIDLRFEICDNFGVDEHDLYAPGLLAFWVLQHERGSAHYAPFVNAFDLPVTLSGTF